MQDIHPANPQFSLLFSPVSYPDLDLVNDVEQERNDDQGEEGRDDQSVDHCPGQRPPEDHIVSTQVEIGIKLREHREEVKKIGREQ